MNFLISSRDSLWSQVKTIPGVVSIGVGMKDNHKVLVIFVTLDSINQEELPAHHRGIPVIIEGTGSAVTHGAIESG